MPKKVGEKERTSSGNRQTKHWNKDVVRIKGSSKKAGNTTDESVEI
jgi:hypothetical protein